MTKSLIFFSKKKQNFNSQDLLKNNALHFAVKFYGMKRNYSNFDKIKKLLTTEININSVNFFNQSPLMFAAIYNDEKIDDDKKAMHWGLTCDKGQCQERINKNGRTAGRTAGRTVEKTVGSTGE